MSSRQERVQILYEISLSIGRGNGLGETAREALSAYLRKLNCSAGSVLERVDTSDGVTYEQVVSVPEHPRQNDGYRAALAALPDDATMASSFHESLPKTIDRTAGETVYLFALESFGVLVLVKNGAPLDRNTLGALGSLNEKLADACRAERTEQRLREEQRRFETVFETVPEPLARVDTATDEPVLRDVNRAFAETFDCERTAVQGVPLADLLAPALTPWDPLETGLQGDEAVEREVSYRTGDGRRQFIFRAAPITPGTDTESVCLFTEVTAQRERQRTLERLYSLAEDLFDSPNKERVCERTMDAASEILGFERSEISLYDRAEEALVPAASTAHETPERTLPTDVHSLEWSAYQSEEAQRVADLDAAPGAISVQPADARSALVLPLGTHGAFATYASEADAFDEIDEYFGRFLAAIVRTALDRVGRERVLEDLHRMTSDLVTADSVEAVSERLVEQAAETFDLPISGIWRYDEVENALRPVATSAAAADLFDQVPTFGPGDSIAWGVYQSGEPQFVEDIQAASNAYNENSSLQSEIIAPIGDFGIIAAGSRLSHDFSQTEFNLLQTITTGAESAFQLVEQREELRVLDQILARILRHNIRNDLTAIQGRAELIAERGSEDCAALAEEIVTQSESLRSTATNAREIRTVVDRRGQRTTVGVDETVEDALEQVREAHPDAEVEIDGDDLRVALQSHPNLTYAIRHAVTNAIEHTGVDTTVTITTDRRDDVFAIEISDDGPGIPDSELAPLQNGEETALSHGSGAGLWIIDRVLEYSGGTVSFRVDDGTTVSLLFPTTLVEHQTA